MIDIPMAQIVILPDQAAFEPALEALESARMSAEALEPPEFCVGLAATCILVTGTSANVGQALENSGICVSGIIPLGRFRRDVPTAGPPDPRWREVLGEFRITSVKPSFTDPTRLRIEAVCGNSLDPLIPYMAKLIRGGAFDPKGPVLAFEEEHRVISFGDERLVICRSDDLLDAWILVRSAVELVLQAWESREVLTPEKTSRMGIGAVEIFKRLPATNCGLCGHQNCMEFALGLLTGQSRVEQCPQVVEQPEYRDSLEWLMRAIGLTPRNPPLP